MKVVSAVPLTEQEEKKFGKRKRNLKIIRILLSK